jgi:hypothetical protein
MTKSKTQKAESKMNFEKEKLELVKLRIRNKYYERSDVLEKVVMSIIHDKEVQQKSNS